MGKSRPSGVKCAVSNCNSLQKNRVRLFRYSDKYSNHDLWLKNCQFLPNCKKRIFICEKHFEPNVFLKKKLKLTAVPTLALPERTLVNNNEINVEHVLANLPAASVRKDLRSKHLKGKVAEILQAPQENSSIIVIDEESETIENTVNSVTRKKIKPTTIRRARKRGPSNTMKLFQGAFVKLAKLSDYNACQNPLNEFDAFCNTLALQLKQMPLQNALICQGKLQEVMTQQRLALLNKENPSSSNLSFTTTQSATTSFIKGQPPIPFILENGSDFEEVGTMFSQSISTITGFNQQ